MQNSSTSGDNIFCSSVFVVGDEDQRIYGWRGAVVDVVSSFMKDFEGCQMFTLEPNFRSTQVRTCTSVQ
jgi:superfamily I DNA/RNA helicase